MQSDNKTKQILATFAVLVVVTVIVMGAKALNSKTTASQLASSTQPTTSTSVSTGTTTTTPATTSTSPSSQSTSTAPSVYKNGTYSSDGLYNSPGGVQSIGVSVTIQNDVVTAAVVTDQATDGDSDAYQQMFIQGYKSYVVGKKVGNIYLSSVSGASLTSQGFNNALDKIKNKAHA